MVDRAVCLPLVNASRIQSDMFVSGCSCESVELGSTLRVEERAFLVEHSDGDNSDRSLQLGDVTVVKRRTQFTARQHCSRCGGCFKRQSRRPRARPALFIEIEDKASDPPAEPPSSCRRREAKGRETDAEEELRGETENRGWERRVGCSLTVCGAILYVQGETDVLLLVPARF